jgi:hypothetical protein
MGVCYSIHCHDCKMKTEAEREFVLISYLEGEAREKTEDPNNLPFSMSRERADILLEFLLLHWGHKLSREDEMEDSFEEYEIKAPNTYYKTDLSLSDKEIEELIETEHADMRRHVKYLKDFMRDQAELKNTIHKLIVERDEHAYKNNKLKEMVENFEVYDQYVLDKENIEHIEEDNKTLKSSLANYEAELFRCYKLINIPGRSYKELSNQLKFKGKNIFQRLINYIKKELK